MRLPEPLRYSPFALHRRPSLQSILHGERSGPILPVDNTRSSGAARPAGYSPPVYMGGLPKEYVPNVGPMHVPVSDYTPYDATMPPMPVRPIGSTGGMGASALGSSPGSMGGLDVTNADGPIDEDFLALLMKMAFDQAGAAAIPERYREMLEQFLEKHPGGNVSDFDHDLQGHLSEIQMAVERMRTQPSADPTAGVPNEALYGHETMMYTPTVEEPAGGALDPSRYEPQDFFDREMEMVDRQFAGPDLSHQDFGAGIDALVAAQDALFRAPMDTMDQLIPGQPAGPQPANLEQIIEAHDIPGGMMPNDAFAMPSYEGCSMTQDFFHQQMQDALGTTGPRDLYNDPALLGYGMPETYDEQLQQMMDPYAVPGMYDPMLPGPMPDFGPGGGP